MRQSCVYSLDHIKHLSVMKNTASDCGSSRDGLSLARPCAQRFVASTLGRALGAASLAITMAACTPALDWRDVRNSDAGYTATFPGKPASASREFVLAGQVVTLRLQATTAGTSYFAVGEIPLTAQQQAHAQAILEALKASLRNNINAHGAQEKPVNAGGVIWQEMRASGTLREGKPAVLGGRFLVQPGRILEVLAMGERAELTDEVIDQWLGSVKLGVLP